VIRDFLNNTTPAATKETAGRKRRRPADSPPPTTDPFYSDPDPGVRDGDGVVLKVETGSQLARLDPPPRGPRVPSVWGEKVDMPLALVRSPRYDTTVGLS